MGNNTYGKLGIHSKSVSKSSSPCLVEALVQYKAIKISCGKGHTAAIVDDGQLVTWGCGLDGQLGLGNLQNYSAPQLVSAYSQENINAIAISVDCGANHTAVISNKGDLHMFGSCEYGQLGTGKYTNELLPVKVDIGSRIKMIACGVQHTLLLNSMGKVFAAGNNSFGQLGIGNIKYALTFTRISTFDNSIVKNIAAGQNSAATTANGDLYIWGAGSFGEHLTPFRVKGLLNPIVSLSIGDGFGCSIDSIGGLYSWGSNRNSELGGGDYKPRNQPEQVTLLKNKKVTAVSCGANFVIALGINIQCDEDKSDYNNKKSPENRKNSRLVIQESFNKQTNSTNRSITPNSLSNRINEKELTKSNKKSGSRYNIDTKIAEIAGNQDSIDEVSSRYITHRPSATNLKSNDSNSSWSSSNMISKLYPLTNLKEKVRIHEYLKEYTSSNQVIMNTRSTDSMFNNVLKNIEIDNTTKNKVINSKENLIDISINNGINASFDNFESRPNRNQSKGNANLNNYQSLHPEEIQRSKTSTPNTNKSMNYDSRLSTSINHNGNSILNDNINLDDNSMIKHADPSNLDSLRRENAISKLTIKDLKTRIYVLEKRDSSNNTKSLIEKSQSVKSEKLERLLAQAERAITVLQKVKKIRI